MRWTRRVLTMPVSALLKFKLSGTLTEPVWEPDNWPSDLVFSLVPTRDVVILPAFDGGIKAGLSHHISRELAIQTVLGAARLAKESTEHPAVLRARVTSPAGTTINGQHVLENAGFRGIVMNAVEAAVKRSTELSGA